MHPTPENTPGLFLEHFDLDPPNEDGNTSIVYPLALESARIAADQSNWTFRSYSDGRTPATSKDFVQRKIHSFPTYFLFRDGIELGRTSMLILRPEPLLAWADQLTGASE